MKNFSIGLNIVLLIAVIVLYVLHFSGKTKNVEEQTGLSAVVPNAKIVYINMDSLLSNYEQSRELNEAFLKKVENNRTELNMKAKMFEQEVVAFQQKLDNNGFVTRERAEQAQADLMVKRQNLQKLDQELMETTQREQIELNQKLFTEITNFLKEYNKTKGYQLILSTTVGGNVFYAEDGFDITKDVVNQLNQQYRNK
ncbi:MAG: OmpH family outer membrane protein [Marinifilaceae bacterium]|nr:OmpH family outer membrane protein [Marinifilaceae bacterium]